MIHNDDIRLLSDLEIAAFAASISGISAWCTYRGPMWPGAHVEDQYVRVLFQRNGQWFTAEYHRPTTSHSDQLHLSPGTQTPLAGIKDFVTLYGTHTIHVVMEGT